MTIYNYYIFTEIVRDMNLHVTAERLLISQQGLSTHIKQIESYYGAVLFERKPKLKLTPDGELLLKEAQLITDADKRLKLLFNSKYVPAEGSIRIACSMVRSTLFMPEVLKEFNRAYPYVSVIFTQYNGGDCSILENNNTDIFIGHNTTPTRNIRCIPLYTVSSAIGISEKIVSKYFPEEDFGSFCARYADGIDFCEIPSEIPLAFTKAKGEPWIFQKIPMLQKRKITFVKPTDLQKLSELASNGSAILLYSYNYLSYIKNNTPGILDDVAILYHKADGNIMKFEETCSYLDNEPHPDYFYYFINVLQSVTKKLAD